jgi:SAM-dependent methyltransferase
MNRHAQHEISELPLVWHYGLMAEFWARFKTDAPEVPQLLKLIGRFGQPVLDLACGSGRILTNLLIAGVDADGVDISDDMLAGARRAASAHGFSPVLLTQPMHELNLSRQYGTIVICDSFGLGGGRRNDLSMFRRCHEQLKPGGALVFNLGMEYSSNEAWDLWKAEARERLPADWPDIPITRVLPDGSEFRLRIRTVSVDPMAQSYAREMSIEKWQSGRRVAAESSLLRGSLYLAQELLLMLQVAGFQTVRTFGGFTDNDATDRDAELVFVAIK